MNINLRTIVSTNHGVYRPAAFRTEALLLAAAVAGVVALLSLGRVSPGLAITQLLVLLSLVIWRASQFGRHGRLGRPLVAIDAGTLTFARPNDTRKDLHLPLQDLNRIVVHGRLGHRTYRFVRFDDTWIEVVPMWGREVEAVVGRFLQAHMPPSIQVAIEEPQTLFAFVRGDGP